MVRGFASEVVSAVVVIVVMILIFQFRLKNLIKIFDGYIARPKNINFVNTDLKHQCIFLQIFVVNRKFFANLMN